MEGANTTWGAFESTDFSFTASNVLLQNLNCFSQITTDHNRSQQITTDRNTFINTKESTVSRLYNEITLASIDDESVIKLLLEIIISCVLCGFAGLPGIITNIICIAVFWRQGFKDHVNITLQALALSDLCCSLTMFWSAVAETVYVIGPPPFLFEPFGLLVMTGSFPRLIFTRVTSWLTALIALERCVCVALPFKVRVIFSPRNSSLITFSVFSIVFTSHMFIYYSRSFKMVYNPRFNMSQVVMATVQERVNDSFYISTTLFIFLPLVNYFFILSCTLMMLWKLKISTTWRTSVQAGFTGMRKPEMAVRNQQNAQKRIQSDEVIARKVNVSKEKRLTKMIATTTSVFVVCSTPINVALAVTLFVPGFQSTGDNSLAYSTMHMFGNLMETINSSVGLFVYYHQSSKFKSWLLQMIPVPKKDSL